MNKIDKAIDFLVEEDPLFSNPIVFDDAWLDDHVDGSWIKRPDGKIDVTGSVSFSDLGLRELPYLFGKVSRHFDCAHNELASLEGSPVEVGDRFVCSYNKLTSLKHGPQKAYIYVCNQSQLTSLTGAPEYVRGGFDCNNNQLTSLTGAPKKTGDFWCRGNHLTNLEGSPERVIASFYANDNPLESLAGAPKHIGRRFRSDQFTEMQYREYVKEHYK